MYNGFIGKTPLKYNSCEDNASYNYFTNDITKNLTPIKSVPVHPQMLNVEKFCKYNYLCVLCCTSLLTSNIVAMWEYQ